MACNQIPRTCRCGVKCVGVSRHAPCKSPALEFFDLAGADPHGTKRNADFITLTNDGAEVDAHICAERCDHHDRLRYWLSQYGLHIDASQ
jgi:hypothetical protein